MATNAAPLEVRYRVTRVQAPLRQGCQWVLRLVPARRPPSLTVAAPGPGLRSLRPRLGPGSAAAQSQTRPALGRSAAPGRERRPRRAPRLSRPSAGRGESRWHRSLRLGGPFSPPALPTSRAAARRPTPLRRGPARPLGRGLRGGCAGDGGRACSREDWTC